MWTWCIRKEGIEAVSILNANRILLGAEVQQEGDVSDVMEAGLPGNDVLQASRKAVSAVWGEMIPARVNGCLT